LVLLPEDAIINRVREALGEHAEAAMNFDMNARILAE
jgi:hypothetical protein